MSLHSHGHIAKKKAPTASSKEALLAGVENGRFACPIMFERIEAVIFSAVSCFCQGFL